MPTSQWFNAERDGRARESGSVAEHPWRALARATLIVMLAGAMTGASNVPRPWAPFSLVSILPGMVSIEVVGLFAQYFSPVVAQLAVMIGGGLFIATLFLIWSWHIGWPTRVIPDGSLIAFSIVGVLNLILVIVGWSYGVEYQGRVHTILITAYNLIAACACVALYRRHRRAPSYATSLAFHTVFFAALGYCAFPWLGELI
jgi:hypothetical protein